MLKGAGMLYTVNIEDEDKHMLSFDKKTDESKTDKNQGIHLTTDKAFKGHSFALQQRDRKCVPNETSASVAFVPLF